MPFTQDQFLMVFQQYNLGVWPAQVVLVCLGAVAILLVLSRDGMVSRVVGALLSVFWIWMGLAYHFAYFSAINKAAYLFGALFLFQGILLAERVCLREKLFFRYPRGPKAWAGGLFLAYALFIYPLLGALLGHSYPQGPTFGLPCPTTIFTIGLLFWSEGPALRSLLVIPLLWSIVGSVAAFSLGMREDLGLLVAGMGGLSLFFEKKEGWFDHGRP